MTVSPQTPPRLPAWLLEHMLPTQALEYALGDLAEEYVLRLRGGSSSASGWYWLQICRSLPAFFSVALKHAGWLRTIGVALAVYVGAGAVEALMNEVIGRIAEEGLATDIARMLAGLMTIGAGGYVAARIRPPAAPVLAIIVFAVVVVLITIGDAKVIPVWYQLAFLVGGPLAPLAGGVMASHRSRRRPA